MTMYYAIQKDSMIYERILNADGVADTIQTDSNKPWLVRDYGEKLVVTQDGFLMVISREDFDKTFHRSYDANSCGVFECFHCGHRTVIWDCDYDYSDFGYEGEGIVQVLHCENCGARIEYLIDCRDDDTEHSDDAEDEA